MSYASVGRRPESNRHPPVYDTGAPTLEPNAAWIGQDLHLHRLALLASASIFCHRSTTPPPRFERGPRARQTRILTGLDHEGIRSLGGFVCRRLSGVRRPRVHPSGIHGSGAGPIRTGICGSGDRPVAGYRHRPLGPRARVERASRRPQPRVLAVGRSRSLGCGAGSCTPFSSS